MNNVLRIFLAEDNPGDVCLVRESLREHHLDYELWLAADGAEARRYLSLLGASCETPCPDLVMLDLNLPMVDGFELIELFRKHPLCSTTPVIVVTSSNAPRDRERTARLGVARYFNKPSELSEFLELGSVVRDLATERGLLARR